MALGWPTHQFHRLVVDRLERRPAPRWATCALTQLGFVRLSANPAIAGVQKTPAEAVALLAEMSRDSRHVYIDALPALPTVAAHFQRLLGHQQVTDAYLLAAAEAGGARLLTLDRRILPPAGARNLIEVIRP